VKTMLTKIIVIGNDDAMRKWMIESIAVEADIQIVVHCATFDEGQLAIRELPADVIVTEFCLLDGHGSDLIRLARSLKPDAKIMVISGLGDQQSVIGTITTGPTGFLFNDFRQTDFVKAIREVLGGQPQLSTSIAQFAIQSGQNGEYDAANENILTKRELDVLWGIAKGYTYNDVAERLKISKTLFRRTLKISIANWT